MQRQLILSLLGAVVGLCLTPIATFACRSPIRTAHSPKLTQTQQAIDLTPWQGTYNFIESSKDDGPPIYVNYDIRISLARCGWRSFVTVNGHLTSLDLQTEVRAIDANTIGLYYQQEIIPTLQPAQFKPGQQLLRIQRQIPPQTSPKNPPPDPTYRVYFDALTPLIPNHTQTGLEIPPPQPLISPPVTP